MSASLILAAVLAIPRLGNIVGTVVRSTPTRVFVGTAAGTVYGFERNGNFRYELKGGTGPVTDIAFVDGNVMWSCKDSGVLFAVAPDLSPQQINLPGTGFRGPIRRLMTWKNHVVAQSDTDTRFIHSRDRKIKGLSAFLPRDQAAIAEQGPILAHWQGNRGMIFSVRRIGKYLSPREPGGFDDMAKISAWSLSGGRSRFLGAYTCAAAKFRNAEGPEVTDFNEGREVRLPFGAADIGNFRIGPEGVAILERDRIRLLPFAKRDWGSIELDLPISPRYSQKFSFSGNQAWWIDGRRVLSADLEQGNVDVFTVLDKGVEVYDLSADNEGCYVASSQGIRRLENEYAAQGWLHYTRGYGDTPQSYEQKQLAKLVADIDRYGGITGLSMGPTQTLIKLIDAAKIGIRPLGAKRLKSPKPTRDIEFGDVVVQGGESRLYVGDGRTLSLDGKSELETDLDLSNFSHAYRILEGDYQQFGYSRRTFQGGRLSVAPVGLLSSNSRLGHRYFLTWKRGSPYDRPHKPSHQRMAQEIAEWAGTPYVWGGTSKGDGADCSGFVMNIFRKVGVYLPRTSQAMGQAGIGTVVTDEIRWGDVIVIRVPNNHVMIYVGNGQVAESTRPVNGTYPLRYRSGIVRRFL